MIVNPQLFNYRLIIGSLLLALTILGAYCVHHFVTLEAKEQVMKQEVYLVQKELSRMLMLYEKSEAELLKVTTDLQLVNSKKKRLKDSLKTVALSASSGSNYNTEISVLLEERKQLFNKLTSALKANDAQKYAAQALQENLEVQALEINQLNAQNKELKAFVKKMSVLTINNLQCTAYTLNGNGAREVSVTASEVNNFEVCFMVLKNQFTAEGKKDLYLQVLNPEGFIVSNKGKILFNDEEIPYTGKTSINYKCANVSVCSKITLNGKEKLVSGTYSVAVFHDNAMLGTTKIVLN
ncbi:hypothetical protein ACFSQP_05430 [Bizionia sediminis]|uniref:Chromosome partitioning protein ParA n=1 Tax=Bizionia sediminis TaxID=1737064 RepID=A0ABW5KQE7_9FLAO